MRGNRLEWSSWKLRILWNTYNVEKRIVKSHKSFKSSGIMCRGIVVMKNSIKMILGIAVLFMLLTFLLSITPLHHIKASWSGGTIYIRENGNVEPLNTPIKQNGNTYTLTDDITSNSRGIIIEKEGVSLEGAGFWLSGPGYNQYDSTGYYAGVTLLSVGNIKIENIQCHNFGYGILADSSSNNNFSNNYITGCGVGGIRIEMSQRNTILNNTLYINNYDTTSGNDIFLLYCSNSTIEKNQLQGSYSGIGISDGKNNEIKSNTIKNCEWYGISLSEGNNPTEKNTVSKNLLVGNGVGIYFGTATRNLITNNTIQNCTNIFEYSSSSGGNSIYYNNFVDNNQKQNLRRGRLPAETWDDGVSKGNYWSDYAGIDANNDGIGDSPYVISSSNVDNYPLMKYYNSELTPSPSPTVSTILTPSPIVEPSPSIPELPSFILFPIFMATMLTGAIIYKKKQSKVRKKP
jgi:parallel beta-helix repeat protein